MSNKRKNTKTNKNNKPARTVQTNKTPAKKNAKKKWSFKNLFNKKQTNKATKPKQIKLSKQNQDAMSALGYSVGDLVDLSIKKHPDKNRGHFHGIIDKIDGNYISVGFTTKEFKGKNATNYPLELDPLNTDKKSYMRRQATIDPKSKYYDDRQGFMTPKDHAIAKEYAERAKQKYISKKRK